MQTGLLTNCAPALAATEVSEESHKFFNEVAKEAEPNAMSLTSLEMPKGRGEKSGAKSGRKANRWLPPKGHLHSQGAFVLICNGCNQKLQGSAALPQLLQDNWCLLVKETFFGFNFMHKATYRAVLTAFNGMVYCSYYDHYHNKIQQTWRCVSWNNRFYITGKMSELNPQNCNTSVNAWL